MKNLINIFWILIIIFISCAEPKINDPTNSNIVADYFPLKVGNEWSFSFRKYHIAYEWYQIDGTLNWKVIDKISEGKRDVYLIRESVKGKRREYFPFPEPAHEDTTDYFSSGVLVIEDSLNGWLTFNSPNFMLLDCTIKTKYGEGDVNDLINAEIILPVNYYLVYDIGLRINVGITNLNFYSKPTGEMILKEYDFGDN